jgi:DNA-binding transcriptional regulator LsrR (DeoR family)
LPALAGEAARTVNPTFDDLLAIPELILAAGVTQKVPVIKAAIRAKLAHVLITDVVTTAALV